MLSKDVWRGGGEKKVRQINNGILSGLCSLSLSFSLSYSSCSGPLQLSQADFIAEPWKVSKTGKRWQDQLIYVCIILNKWFARKCVSNLLWSNKSTYQLCCWTKKLVPPCLAAIKRLNFRNDGHAGSVISSKSSKMEWIYQMELRTTKGGHSALPLPDLYLRICTNCSQTRGQSPCHSTVFCIGERAGTTGKSSWSKPLGYTVPKLQLTRLVQ